MKYNLFFGFLLASLLYLFSAAAQQHRKTGVSLTIDAGQQIQYNKPDYLGVYSFQAGIPVAASVDFNFSSKSNCGFMMSLAAEYAPYKVSFVYKGPRISVWQEYRLGVGALRLPMYFFLRTRKDKMLFALGGSINLRKMINYSASLDYDNPYALEYASIASFDNGGFPFSLDMRYLYRFTSKSAISLHVGCNFLNYNVLSLDNSIGPRIDYVQNAHYRFEEMQRFITVSLGYQVKLFPAKRKSLPAIGHTTMEEVKP